MMRPAPAIGNEPVDHEVIVLSGGTTAADPAHELPMHPSSDAPDAPDGLGGPVVGPLRLSPRALLIGVFAGAVLVARAPC
jgi:hypothetical protein